MTNPTQIFVRDFDSSQLPLSSPLGESERNFIEKAKVLDVEIGCGVGWHPIQYATNHPERSLLAIEHTRDKFEKFQRRFEHHELSNLLPIHANAISWMTNHLSEQSISKLLILYPNPNPKDKSKRWFCMPFMHRLLKMLREDGEIILATNEKGYRDEALNYALNFWKLRLEEEKIIEAPQSQYRTHFEKKYIERGETCWNLIFKKSSMKPC